MTESVRQGINNALLMRSRSVKLMKDEEVDNVEVKKRMKLKVMRRVAFFS